jgi:hypothetical protein
MERRKRDEEGNGFVGYCVGVGVLDVLCWRFRVGS